MRQVLEERRLKGPGHRSVTMNVAESPLGWLASRGRISERQLVAGETLRADYERAQLGASVTMRWDVAPRAVRGGRSVAPERALGWPARAGKLVLGLALDRLADFYRVR